VFTANNLEPYFEKLSEKSWVILPIEQSFALELLDSARNKQSAFRPATTSRLTEPEPALRSDRIMWIEDQTSLVEKKALGSLQNLKTELREYFRVGLESIECHYSIYEPGQFYVRHRDTTHNENRRVFSFVIYLNFDWQVGDGGHLVGYGTDENLLFNISPQAGQMILFKSELEHEVQRANRTRYALTGWIRR
jgi:SM-20-related protein